MAQLGLAMPAVTMSEAQAYVRIETGEEEAILAGLIRTASDLCEVFIGKIIIARDFAIDVPASSCWQRLEIAPVSLSRSKDLRFVAEPTERPGCSMAENGTLETSKDAES